MAARTATHTILNRASADGNQHGPAQVWNWETAVAAADTFTAVEVPISLPDRTVQLTGTFDSATVLVVGSIDGITYFTLTDGAGNAFSKTAAGGDAISELVRYIGATHSGGGGRCRRGGRDAGRRRA